MRTNDREQKTEWINRWAGSYTFISCSYWASHYATTLKRILGMGLENVLFIHKKGTVSFFVKSDEFIALGGYLANKTTTNEAGALALLSLLKEDTDIIIATMDELEGTILSPEQYATFYPIFERHLAYHNFMKKTVDFLSPEVFERLFPQFEDARKYSEAVYSKTEQFFRSLAKAIANKENYSPEAITCLTQDELENYIKKGTLPNENGLRERFEASIILHENRKIRLFTGSDVETWEGKLFSENGDEVRGTVVFRGKVKGKCRIVNNPLKEHAFNKGDILITGMTRPEFMPFMEKASAIVTDAGGLLCHAAITAREMKIPCIVGTEKATRMFNDGDLIEVDAENGIIRREI
ncbi:hypothetical protein HYW21_05365 [Candidatus Woesearchaeota archaeon]|nr:hypothetical protein [Candidatus Woesearchaeota archaeon]